MCGIFGQVNLHGADPALVERMARRLAHRGPDGYGIHTDGVLSFGAGRLAIIDLSAPAGPIFNEDGSVGVVFNGEIYNYRALREELERAGHVFRTRTDTEVIVHGYEQWGRDVLGRLRGMFALALWEQRSRRLLLARDRAGEKPLYTWQHGDEFLFASELKALLEHPGISRRLDPQAVTHYMILGYVPSPGTILEGVRKLEPGQWLALEEGRTQAGYFWQAQMDTTGRPPPYREAVQQVRAELERAVESRMVSDVPVGAFLSGGIDSTAVAAIMTRVLGAPLNTFTVGFDPATNNDVIDRKFNVDLRFAELAAQQYGTRHHAVLWRDTPALVNLLPKLVYSMDEPLMQPAIVQTALISGLARLHGIPVLLTGDGGDELFCGYTHFRTDWIVERYRRLPGLLRESILNPVLEALPDRSGHFKALARKSREADPTRRYLSWKRMMSFEHLAELTGQAGNSAYEVVNAALLPLLTRPHTPYFTDRLAFVQLASWIADESNMRVDKMTMAMSIESRAPMLDHDFMRLALGLPLAYKIRQRDFKVVLKDAVADLLPEPILKRPKWGFLSPMSHWLRNTLHPLVERYLSAEYVSAVGVCQPEAVSRMVREHVDRADHHFSEVWSLLMLHLWYAIMVDGSCDSGAPITPEELVQTLTAEGGAARPLK
jgi:asparagine synthase (glutamine-hydrolysing)